MLTNVVTSLSYSSSCNQNYGMSRIHYELTLKLFQEGELLEMGTHEELLRIEGGKYAHLFRLQSEGYAEFKNGSHASTKSCSVNSQVANEPECV